MDGSKQHRWCSVIKKELPFTIYFERQRSPDWNWRNKMRLARD